MYPLKKSTFVLRHQRPLGSSLTANPLAQGSHFKQEDALLQKARFKGPAKDPQEAGKGTPRV